MNRNRMSEGVNESETFVYHLFCRVFTPAHVFANPIKNDGRELCDVLVRLMDSAFLVSVRDRKFNSANLTLIEWGRWSRETIGDKVKSLTKGGRYLRSRISVVYLDTKKTRTLPSWVATTKPEKIHKIIVGFGIPDTVSEHKVGTERTVRLCLAKKHDDDSLFTIGVVKSEDEFVHVFDIAGLELVLSFADTPFELNDYLLWREGVISEGNVILVNGEEDLVAHWMIKRFKVRLLVDPEDFRDESGRLPGMIYLGMFEQFKRSPIYRWKVAASEASGFWDRLAAYVADGASQGLENADSLALYGGLLSAETKFLRAYVWHELKRKSDGDGSAVDVVAVSSVMPDLVYYFSLQHEEMSTEHREKNITFMAHAVAGQMKKACLGVGLLPRDALARPIMTLALPQGSPIIQREMASVMITFDDALRWLSSESADPG